MLQTAWDEDPYCPHLPISCLAELLVDESPQTLCPELMAFAACSLRLIHDEVAMQHMALAELECTIWCCW